jgi:hypothetical protein
MIKVGGVDHQGGSSQISRRMQLSVRVCLRKGEDKFANERSERQPQNAHFLLLTYCIDKTCSHQSGYNSLFMRRHLMATML